MVSELKVFSQSESNHKRCGPSDETFLIQRHKKYPLRSRRNAKINIKTLSTPARRCMAGITRIDTKNFCRADRWSDRMCFSHKGTKKIHPAKKCHGSESWHFFYSFRYMLFFVSLCEIFLSVSICSFRLIRVLLNTSFPLSFLWLNLLNFIPINKSLLSLHSYN